MAEFTQCASDVRTFRDADVDADGRLSSDELGNALEALGLPHAVDDITKVLLEHEEAAAKAAKGYLSLAAFGAAIQEMASSAGLAVRPMTHATAAVIVSAGLESTKAKVTGGDAPSLVQHV